MDGRVKTLHPKLYAGLLARARRRRSPALGRQEHDIEFVDLVCVNLYPFERTAGRRPGRARGRRDREHRHRRPDDDPRGGQELRVRRRRRQPREPTTRCSRSCASRTVQLSSATRECARRRGVRLHGSLRHRDRALVRGEAARTSRRCSSARTRSVARPALRREPPPARRLLPAGRGSHARAVDGRPARRQAALLQQPARPRRRGACCSPSSRSRRASIVKHNNPCGVAARRDALDAYSHALACDPL